MGRIYRKGRFLIWNERVSGDRILISMNVSSITTVLDSTVKCFAFKVHLRPEYLNETEKM